MAHPTQAHYSAAQNVLRYLVDTCTVGINFGAKGGPLSAYCDADYAGDLHTRRSTTGYVFILHGGAISWNSKLHVTVAASTAEAEYMSASSCVKEALWLRTLLCELHLLHGPVRIHTDNQAALALIKNPLTSQRAKHIDVQYHFARERALRNEVAFEYCPTSDMVADCMTKALSRSKLEFCAHVMGIA